MKAPTDLKPGMRWQLNGPWPFGQWLIPGNTILSSDDWTWNGMELPWPPPLNSVCLTQSAYNVMCEHYQFYHHLIHTANPLINRHKDANLNEFGLSREIRHPHQQKELTDG